MTSNERYDMGRFMSYESEGYDIVTSYFVKQVPLLPEGGRYVIIGEEGRPDLLSWNIYGDVQYWWILMIYNGILDLCSLPSGLVIKYPSLNSIEELFLQLRSKEVAKNRAASS